MTELEERVKQLEEEVRALKEKNTVEVINPTATPKTFLSVEEMLESKKRADEAGIPVGPVGSGWTPVQRNEGN